MEKFLQKNSFIERLNLSSDVEKAVLEYHVRIASIPIDLDESARTYIRGLLDTYSKLLLIARTPYYSEKEVQDLGLLNIHYEWMDNSDYNRYFVGYKPKDFSTDAWFSLCDAFSECGFFRPFARDNHSLKWPEIDHVFKSLADEYYAYSENRYVENYMIGCFNPSCHSDYERFNRMLGANDLERLVKFLYMVTADATACFSMLFCGEYKSGDFERWVMEHEEVHRVLGRSEVIRNVNRIYLGEKITIEI